MKSYWWSLNRFSQQLVVSFFVWLNLMVDVTSLSIFSPIHGLRPPLALLFFAEFLRRNTIGQTLNRRYERNSARWKGELVCGPKNLLWLSHGPQTVSREDQILMGRGKLFLSQSSICLTTAHEIFYLATQRQQMIEKTWPNKISWLDQSLGGHGLWLISCLVRQELVSRSRETIGPTRKIAAVDGQ